MLVLWQTCRKPVNCSNRQFVNSVPVNLHIIHSMKTIVVCLGLLTVLFIRAEAADGKLIQALIQIESSGRDNAVGDNGEALGPLQIHQEMVEDVNRLYGTSYKHRDMFVRAKAVDVCHKYLDFYGSEKRLGRPPTSQDHARIWNGGPSGWKRKATQGYWAKVRRHL